jgi:hypothetical protein
LTQIDGAYFYLNLDNMFTYKPNFDPDDIDLSDGFKNTFGMCEYERAAVRIIEYLKSDSNPLEGSWLKDMYDPYIDKDNQKWTKIFTPDILGDTTLFAMLCAAGWISNNYFPKGTFYVSEDFIKRLEEKRNA